MALFTESQAKACIITKIKKINGWIVQNRCGFQVNWNQYSYIKVLGKQIFN